MRGPTTGEPEPPSGLRGQEGGEGSGIHRGILGTTHLTGGVHRQHRCPDVDRRSTGQRRRLRADGRASGPAVAGAGGLQPDARRSAARRGGNWLAVPSVCEPGRQGGEGVTILLRIHDERNEAMRLALDQVGRLSIVRGAPIMIRVESFE